MNCAEKLSLLRTAMKSKGFDAYIIPSTDPHQSEYVANRWKSREWISNFTGSAGTVVVTQDHAGVWTDSRYFIQAEQELADSEFVMHKILHQGTPQYISWIKEQMNAGAKVGIDGEVMSKAMVQHFQKVLDNKQIEIDTNSDLIQQVWNDRPGLPSNELFVHATNYNGESVADKIAKIRMQLADMGAQHHLITTLDDIAWIFNIRSNDVEFNPVVISYALISQNELTLFVSSDKVNAELQAYFDDNNVQIKDYSDIYSAAAEIPKTDTILVDKSSVNVKLYDSITAQIKEGEMPSRHLKAIKNETEIAHLKQVMVKDGVALAHTFYWLEKNKESQDITEYDLAQKLIECRGQQADYFGESFSAIVGFKGNGAIVHYRPLEHHCATIKGDGMLLVDSGGQYLDGTTDITRTFYFGTPTVEEKNAYTRVLKGHIALAIALFPEGTVGGQLDILARQYLWEDGLNYLHGTGHGVGFFLNVHEPPQGFAPGLSRRSKAVLKPGMYTSNEPGYYKEDHFGIRIENLVITEQAAKSNFLSNNTITLYPICTKLIDMNLMTEIEKQWLNDYHKDVSDQLTPQLEGEIREWIKEQCAPIS